MASETTDPERLAKLAKFRDELTGYINRFEAAFDELHEAVVRHAKTPGQYISPHHDYPIMRTLESGFPSFHEVGFYSDSAPRDYVRTVRPRGLLAILFNNQRPRLELPKSAELAEFLRTHDIGKRLSLHEHVDRGAPTDVNVDYLVGDAVERYLHLHGLDAAIEPRRRTDVVMPLIRGTIARHLNLRLVVPITMTHFEVDHFPLSEKTYITRIPEKLQLARARLSTHGTGTEPMVVGAATHAFVSKEWQLEVDAVDEVSRSLSQASSDAIDAIDSFFGALRVATGISTGYAQILWVPRKWTLSYFCDLTPVYGTSL